VARTVLGVTSVLICTHPSKYLPQTAHRSFSSHWLKLQRATLCAQNIHLLHVNPVGLCAPAAFAGPSQPPR
jgi:hypothetical protein